MYCNFIYNTSLKYTIFHYKDKKIEQNRNSKPGLSKDKIYTILVLWHCWPFFKTPDVDSFLLFNYNLIEFVMQLFYL